MAQVRERLAQRFPEVPEQRVAEVVSTSYHDFDAARIRDYLEILVERGAAELLSRGA